MDLGRIQKRRNSGTELEVRLGFSFDVGKTLPGDDLVEYTLFRCFARDFGPHAAHRHFLGSALATRAPVYDIATTARDSFGYLGLSDAVLNRKPNENPNRPNQHAQKRDPSDQNLAQRHLFRRTL
jgi:hypothetical protein